VTLRSKWLAAARWAVVECQYGFNQAERRVDVYHPSSWTELTLPYPLHHRRREMNLGIVKRKGRLKMEMR
jgi:hypothetical protein